MTECREYAECKRRGHAIYDQGDLWFCWSRHIKTEEEFSKRSREILNNAKVALMGTKIYD